MERRLTMSETGLVQHVSDTALWTAIHRAKESERPDAKFQDSFARRLAGERGEQIAAAIAFPEADSWSWMARTLLFDQFIREQAAQGIDMVVNLGAGLDARPYRMPLPDSLTWVEIDLPDILAYKQEILRADEPRCKLERIELDLADVAKRRTVFESLGNRAKRALVITEGVLIYLTAGDAGVLADDLAVIPAFQFWALDLASPGLLRMLRARAQEQFSRGATPLQFAPGNGPEFFRAHRWRAMRVESLLKTAARLDRLPEAMRAEALQPEDPANMGEQPWAGVCLLKRS